MSIKEFFWNFLKNLERNLKLFESLWIYNLLRIWNLEFGFLTFWNSAFLDFILFYNFTFLNITKFLEFFLRICKSVWILSSVFVL